VELRCGEAVPDSGDERDLGASAVLSVKIAISTVEAPGPRQAMWAASCLRILSSKGVRTMHTNALKTSACILHDLSLAVAYGGPLFGKIALYPAVKEISSQRERGKVVETAWNKFNPVNVAAHAVFTATWLVSRKMLKDQHLGKQTEKLVIAKDVLVAGALLTGVANTVAGKLMERKFPEGVRVASGDQPSAATPPEAAKFQRFFKVMGPLNLALIAGAIAVGPVLAVAAFHGSPQKVISRLIRR
jgi:uncharacterized membrane protein